MENLFVTIVCIALILLATVSYATSSLGAADLVSNSFKAMAERASQIGRTDISATGATTVDGSAVDVMLANSGNTSLRNFSRWDVFVRYQDGTTARIPYRVSPAPGWSDNGTFLDEGPDLFEPGILNPGETLRISVRLSPAVADNTTNLVVVSTDKGVKAQSSFGW